MARQLSVYFDDKLTGTLLQDDTGRLRFHYAPSYLRPGSVPLSISMPLSDQEYEDNRARPFFSNLLPDGLARQRVAKLLGVSEKNPFALLEIIGGECAGAFSLYPEGTVPSLKNDQDYTFLTEEKLKEILDLLSKRPLLAGTKDVRMSLAGAQDKLAVAFIDEKVGLPKGGGPTTHIIKPPIADVPESVFNEYFCMSLAAQVGLPTASVTVKQIDNIPYLLIERYDRTEQGPHRLHQEDFCQALSVPPELKYENEGGPSISTCLDLIEGASARPALDKRTFIQSLIFNYLIGNADAHAKNYSFLYVKGKPQLAPLYDLLSTAVYPQLSQKMAMKIGGKYNPETVCLRHWEKLVPEGALSKNMILKELKRLATLVPRKSLALMKSLNKKGFGSPIYDQIQKVIEKRAQYVLKDIADITAV